MRLTTILTVITFLAIAISGFGCDNRSQSGQVPTAKPTVVCTTTMIADLARNLAANRLEVIGLMKAGEDPHIYRPRPTDALQIGKAKILLCNGLHLEGTLAKIIENNLPQNALNIALAEDPRIKPLESEIHKGAPDPHCWFNVGYFKIYAEGCLTAFIKADPAGKSIFEAAAAKYFRELDALDAHVRTQMNAIPKARRVLITSHDAFQYFGREYDVEVHALIGISTEQAPRPQDIEALVRLVNEKQIKSLFVETSVSGTLNDLLRKVGAKAHIEVGGVLYSDSLDSEGSATGTYIGMVRHNVDTIGKALK